MESNNSGIEHQKIKVVIESFPDQSSRNKCIALLEQLSRKTTREQLADRLESLPFLVGTFPKEKGEKLLAALKRSGIQVRSIPVTPSPSKEKAKPPTHQQPKKKTLNSLPFLLLVLLLIGSAYWHSTQQTPQVPEPVVMASTNNDTPEHSPQPLEKHQGRLLCTSETPLPQTSPKSVLEVPPSEMRDYLQQAYRLSPDKRLTQAICHIHRISSKQAASIYYRYQNEKWVFTQDGNKIGSLPAFPGFSETLSLLKDYATPRLNVDAASVSQEELDKASSLVEQFWAPAQFQALRLLDKQWRKDQITPQALGLAARAMLHLQLQNIDRIGLNDDLAARTLAVIAMAQSTGIKMTREAALSAHLMGYEADANQLAIQLNDKDGVKQFVLKNDRRLLLLASHKEATISTRFLYMLVLAQQGDFETWANWGGDHLTELNSMAVLKSALDLNHFGLNPFFTRWLPNLMLLEMAETTGSIQPKSISQKMDDLSSIGSFAQHYQARAELLKLGSDPLVQRFEKEMQLLGNRSPSRFIEPIVEQNYYASAFWSSLYIRGLHYLDRLSSIEASKQFADELGVGASEISSEFLRWYQHLSSSKGGKLSKQELTEDLRQFNQLPWPMMRRILEERRKYLAFGDPKTSQILKLAVHRMDSRPQQRHDLAEFADEMLYNLPLAIDLYRSLVETAPKNHIWVNLWLAASRQDTESLLRVLKDESQSETIRLKALSWLEKLEKPTVEEAKRLFEHLIKKDPDNWKLRRKIVDYLEDQGEYQTALRYIKPWLNRHDPSAGFSWIFANTAQARMHHHLGNHQLAWRTIEPLIESRQFGVMQRGALILSSLGRNEESLSLAAAAYRRYPDLLSALILNLELHWQLGNYDQAAQLIKNHQHNIDLGKWRWKIGAKFEKVFSTKPVEQGISASQALEKAGIGAFERRAFSYALRDGGNLPLAFEIASRLRWRGMGQLDLTIGAYKILQEWQGDEAAFDWVKEQIPRQALNRSSMILYSDGHYELLWTLIEQPLPNDHPEFVWIMRAAAEVKQGLKDSPQLTRLKQYYKDASSDYHHTLGRYLIGLENEDTIIKLISDNNKRCEIAYYLGVKAESEGRLQDANDWYQIAIETGLTRNGEYRWANDQLVIWRNGREPKFFY